jgi:hypothetical protein
VTACAPWWSLEVSASQAVASSTSSGSRSGMVAQIGVSLEDNLVYFTVHTVKKGNMYSLLLEIAL